MKLASGSLLVALVSSAAWAAAPQPAAAPVPAPAPVQISPAQTGPALAAERLDLARRFVGLTLNEDSYFNLMRMAALQAATQRVLASEDGADTPPEVIQQGVDTAFAMMKPVLHGQMPKLLDAYARAYAREFSADELRTMTAFAATPAGRHYLGDPEFILADDGVIRAQQELQEAMEPIGREIQKRACAAKAAERVAAGDKKAMCPLSKGSETRSG